MQYRILLVIFFSVLQIGKFDDYYTVASKSVNDNNNNTINATSGQNITSEKSLSQNVPQSEVLMQTNITEGDGSDNQTIAQLSAENNSSETNSSQEYNALNQNETTINETAGLQPPTGPFDRTLSPEKLKEWMKITPGFFSEPMCAVERGWWLSNVKLSLSDTYIDLFKCRILYCGMDANVKSYSCEYLNSTLEPSIRTDVRTKEALEKCTKIRCI